MRKLANKQQEIIKQIKKSHRLIIADLAFNWTITLAIISLALVTGIANHRETKLLYILVFCPLYFLSISMMNFCNIFHILKN